MNAVVLETYKSLVGNFDIPAPEEEDFRNQLMMYKDIGTVVAEIRPLTPEEIQALLADFAIHVWLAKTKEELTSEASLEAFKNLPDAIHAVVETEYEFVNAMRENLCSYMIKSLCIEAKVYCDVKGIDADNIMPLYGLVDGRVKLLLIRGVDMGKVMGDGEPGLLEMVGVDASKSSDVTMIRFVRTDVQDTIQ